MMWALVSNGNVVACFDDPIKAFEFTYSPDDKVKWERNAGLFRGHVNGKVRYWLTAVPMNPTPVLLSNRDNAGRAEFMRTMQEGRTSPQELFTRYLTPDATTPTMDA